MKNHWLEKKRTKEQRAKVLLEIAKNGIVWFSPVGLNNGFNKNRNKFKLKKAVSK